MYEVESHTDLNVIWDATRENLLSGFYEHVMLKPSYSATETSYNIEIWHIATIHSRKLITKAMISLCECTVWSAPLFSSATKSGFLTTRPI